MLYRAPRGTSDILPQEQAYWRYIEQKAVNICQLYGYGRIDVPTFEDTGLFSRSIGEGTDIVEKEMYTFEDYFKKNQIKYVDPFFEIIKETRIGIRDMISAVGVIKFLYKNKREWKGNRLELLESFFRAYFRRLSYIYFERWESLIDYLGNVITFYFAK